MRWKGLQREITEGIARRLLNQMERKYGDITQIEEKHTRLEKLKKNVSLKKKKKKIEHFEVILRFSMKISAFFVLFFFFGLILFGANFYYTNAYWTGKFKFLISSIGQRRIASQQPIPIDFSFLLLCTSSDG